MTQRRSSIGAALATLLGVVMIGGGAVKLAGVSSQIVAFTGWGLPSWFREAPGACDYSERPGIMMAFHAAPCGSTGRSAPFAASVSIMSSC
jgi:hypothetical protein